MNDQNIIDVLNGNAAVQVEVSINNQDLLKMVGGIILAVILASIIAKKL